MKKLKITATSLILGALAAPTFASADTTVTVKSGDTLFKIATNNKITVNQLKSLNSLSSDTIFVGQKLIVKKDSASSTTSSSVTKKEYRTVTASALNVRNGAGNSYKAISVIEKGTEVEILSVKNGWYYISVNGIKGYSYSSYFSSPKYVSSTNASSNTNTNTNASTSTSAGVTKENTVNIYHSVSAGETLWKISTQYNVSVNDIKSLNKLTTNTIFKGQKLIVKQTTTQEQETNNTDKTTTTVESNTSNTSTTYSVKSGDTLFKIAESFNISVDLLKTSNNLSSNVIYVGQNLKILKSLNIFEKPAEGIITSDFGTRIHPITGVKSTHTGTDFAKNGNVEIKAAANGVVSRSYFSSSYGEVIFIKHNINGQDYETVYAHMKEGTRAVQVGDTVKVGQFIGWMGTTGQSTGQHLHFEVHKGYWDANKSMAVDPILYLKQ